jgi:hypothetical protein
MDGLKSLTALGLRSNDLQLLPRELGWLQQLQQLSVSGNARLRLPSLVHSGGCRLGAALARGPAAATRRGGAARRCWPLRRRKQRVALLL